MSNISRFFVLITIFSSFFIIYSFDAQAASNETIIRGWIKAENKTVNDEVYSFVINEEPKYVAMQFDSGLIRVTPSSCDSKDYIQLCVEEIRLNRTDSATNINYYKAYVTVIRLNAEITASRTAGNTEGIVGDSFEIITLFQNIGRRKAENVSFIEKITDSFIIDLIKFNQDRLDCIINLDSNSIIWKGQLDLGKKVECKYTIIPNEAGIYKLEPNLTYNDGVSNKSVFLSPIILSIKNGTLEIQKSVSRTQLEISDVFVLNASLINILANESPEIVFEVDIPKGIRILNKTFEFDRDGNTVLWKDKLGKGNKINLSLVLMPMVEGNFTIPIKASYYSSGKDIVFEKRVNISSFAKPLGIIYKQSDSKLNSSQNFSLFVALKSNTDKYYYKNIAATLNSDIPTFKGITFTFDKHIRNYSALTVFNSSVATPMLTKNTTFNITLNIGYETEFDQKMLITRNYELYVVEQYKPSEVKFFNLPLAILKNKPTNQTIQGLKLDEEKISSQIYGIIPRTPKGILITVGVIVLLVIVIFIYQRKIVHLF